MGARMVPANGQTTKTKKNLLYVILVGKTFHLITIVHTSIYTSRAIFVLEKGGVLLLGTMLLLGHIRYGLSLSVYLLTFDL